LKVTSYLILIFEQVIFIEQPLLINCVKLAQIGIKSKSLGEALEWDPAEKVRRFANP
jgi:hypothetical protein